MYPGYAKRMVRENRGAIVGVRVAKQRIVNDMTRDNPWNPDRVPRSRGEGGRDANVLFME